MKICLNPGKWAIATGLVSTSTWMVMSLFSQAQAVQQFSCNGRMNNGWTYTAEFLDGRFTQVRWQQAGQPPQVSQLTFEATNALGQPIYRGTLFAAVQVTLIDLSAGDVRPGSEISVGVEEWGWSRGACALSAGNGALDPSGSVAAVRQALLGLTAEPARDWLRQNNFFFTQTMEHTETRVVERWNRDMSPRIIHVVIENGVVTDVVEPL